MTLVTINVPSNGHHRPFHLIGQQVGDHLAVTPIAGNGELSGHFTVSHIASGCCIPSLVACYTCALEAARQLATLDVDWQAMTTDPKGNSATLGAGTLDAIYEITRYYDATCGSRPCLDPCPTEPTQPTHLFKEGAEAPGWPYGPIIEAGLRRRGAIT